MPLPLMQSSFFFSKQKCPQRGAGKWDASENEAPSLSRRLCWTVRETSDAQIHSAAHSRSSLQGKKQCRDEKLWLQADSIYCSVEGLVHINKEKLKPGFSIFLKSTTTTMFTIETDPPSFCWCALQYFVVVLQWCKNHNRVMHKVAKMLWEQENSNTEHLNCRCTSWQEPFRQAP